MPPPDDLDCLSHAELKGLVVKQWEQMVELQRLVAALRDEIARLKGGPGRPNLKPSGMERGTEPKPPGTSGGRKRPRGSTRSKLVIDEERTVTVAAPPRGSRFKGYTSFVVQDQHATTQQIHCCIAVCSHLCCGLHIDICGLRWWRWK